MGTDKTNCGIYNIINLIPNKTTNNLKLYAGSSQNLKKRKFDHFNDLKNNKHHCVHLQNAYNKIKKEYGEDRVKNYFEFKAILYVEKIEDKIKLKEILLEHENIELNKYKKEDGNIDHSKCYNILPTAGSRLGSNHTYKAKKKMKGRKISQEHRDKISRANKNKKQSKETIEKKIKSREGYKHSEDTIEKIRKGNEGKKLSAEHKNKLSLAHKNQILWHTGIHLTQEQKDKMFEDRYISIINLDTMEIFKSMADAAKQYNLYVQNISAVCRGKLKSTGGYRWSYYNYYCKIRKDNNDKNRS